MPTFFMHIRDGEELIEDCEGQEFTSFHAARDEAVHAAREMIAELVRKGEIVDGQKIEIVDASGKTVAVVPLKEQIRLADDEASTFPH